ncbi:MAG: NAD(P)-dependent oxidoreductase [Bradyrhizobium sp.]|uniref:NAD(P)-dependent oxidoreductase n=1 Tax=Bradyrhizobium sp. TaxID=376 RepID=UPI0025BEEF97|nr:NAD(P)-dependent oxidoreductase [Bradyrhizobium sp.]MBI5264108.1 NAD(P)-dependent oxidoreductase [Bradyrhizobium sp.]
MKVAVAGASGRAGSRIVAELSRRGHTVTAIARHPEKIARLPNVTPVQGEVFDQAGLARLWEGHDVAVSSILFLASDAQKLIGAAKDSRVGRYLVVGGAGSLEVAPGVRLVTTPNFPAEYKAEAEKGGAFLDLLRQEKELNWTFISPSALFIDGERTGKFRVGADQLLVDASGRSWISFEDFAVALVDEIERPAHLRSRFTVGY